MPSAANSTKAMSIAARGETAVTIETRVAVRATRLRGLAVERRHQAALGDVQQVAAVDDLGEVGFKFAAAARELRRCGERRGQFAHDGARRVAVVLGDRWLGARAQLLDRGEAKQAGDFANADDQQREARKRGERGTERAEPARARVKVFDQRRRSRGRRRARPVRRARTRTRVPQGKRRRAGSGARDRHRQIEILRLAA